MTSSAITTVAELEEYLYLAMQLEHATLPPYLTALYSIRPGTNRDAAHILRVIAVEEMLHLTIAANLLNAIGGTPDLTRDGFVPAYPAYLPDGEHDFQVHVAGFSRETVDTFLKIERPGLAPAGHAKLVERHYKPGTPVLAARPGAAGLHYYSIGDFYAAIEEGFETLEKQAQAKGKTIFTRDAKQQKRQVTSEYYYSGGGKLSAVTDLDSARAAIRLVIEQGEGETRGVHDADGEIAHFYRFDQLTRGRYYQPGDTPGNPSGPSFTVDWEAAYPVASDVKLAALPAGSELHDAALMFNRRYAEFLALLTRAFTGEPELLLGAVPKMFEFRNLMAELVRNPIPGTQLCAAPTFEVSAFAVAPIKAA